jgi:hypothetical protein
MKMTFEPQSRKERKERKDSIHVFLLASLAYLRFKGFSEWTVV